LPQLGLPSSATRKGANFGESVMPTVLN